MASVCVQDEGENMWVPCPPVHDSSRDFDCARASCSFFSNEVDSQASGPLGSLVIKSVDGTQGHSSPLLVNWSSFSDALSAIVDGTWSLYGSIRWFQLGFPTCMCTGSIARSDVAVPRAYCIPWSFSIFRSGMYCIFVPQHGDKADTRHCFFRNPIL